MFKAVKWLIGIQTKNEDEFLEQGWNAIDIPPPKDTMSHLKFKGLMKFIDDKTIN